MKNQQQEPSGKTTTLCWVTWLTVTSKNVMALMQAGRSRWRIENKTFNTLKNQGYGFAHNYGHGQQHLATVLAYVMLMVFTTDQLIQRYSCPFHEL